MLTKPTLYGNFCDRNGAANHWIIVLTDGSSTWYFSDIEIEGWAIGHVYNIVRGGVSIKQSLNIQMREVSVADVTIDLFNMPYKLNAAGTAWVRPCDELVGIVNKAADIYILSGPGATALTDCLKVFSGYVAEEPTYSDEYIQILLRDNSRSIHKMLPSALAITDYPNVPFELKGAKSPIVYGEIGVDGFNYGNGFSPCVQVTEKKWLVSNHIANSIDAVWIWCDQLNDWMEVIAGEYTVDEDDSGDATITFNNAENIDAYAYLYPDNLRDQAGYNNITNWNLACDRDSGTSASVLANELVTDHYINHINFQFMAGDSTDSNTLNTIGTIDNTGVDIQIAYTIPGGISLDTSNSIIRVYIGASEVGSYARSAWSTTTGAWNTVAHDDWVSDGIFWHPYSSDLYVKLTTHATGPTGVSNVVMNLKEFRLRIGCKLNFLPKIVAVEMKGREYGAWIDEDDPARSNSYNAGDLIKELNFIVESTLRDELGLADANIDVASFDACVNSNIAYGYVSLHTDNQMNSYDLIRLISEQAMFIFYYNCQGKASLIKLDDTTPTADETIYYFDLVEPPIVSYTPFSEIINKVIVNHGWREELQNITQNDTYENATSQTAFGIREQTFDWHQQGETGVWQMGLLLSYNDNALYANKHPKISFQTAGIKYAHLELGNHVQFDATTFDAQFKCFGTSWSGLKFMITNLEKRIDGIQFEVIKLY